MARPKKSEEGAWKYYFLQALRERPVVAYACSKAKITRSTAYRAREKDPEFAAQWDEHMESGLDNVELALIECGMGERKGQIGGLIYLLKARRYEKRVDADAPKKIIIEWDRTNPYGKAGDSSSA